MLTNTHRIMASSLLLLLIGLPVIRADLMCYVCDDCEQLPKDAPLLACNEEFFNPGGSTEASTVTTTTSTEASTTSMSTGETSTMPEVTTSVETTISTETSPQTTETTTPVETTTPEATTESSQSTESTQSTEAPAPTPPTAGPVQTTTGVPTPPAEDLFALAAAALNTTRLVAVDVQSTTPSLAIRQRRAVVDTEFTYHCYSVQVSVNGTMSTDRGCSRVSTYEGVCDLLKIQNNNTELANCNPCSMNACNGGDTLRTSLLATLLVAFVAFALQRN